MMNSQKLLYILPDLAYVVHLLPTKKEFTFSIQSFRQINGQFLDDNEFIEKNLGKLADKLEADTYEVILPDFLFTNTIVGVKESSEAKVKAHLKEKLLPSLDLDEKTHQIETIVLTQHKDEFKVQLSALEKSVLEPLKTALEGKNIVFSSIIPLSWTVKSVVSLEPSITIVQLGAGLFLAQQYIGLDQTMYTPVEDAETFIETVKTLKGAEPSIQTLYLLASELVEDKLREGLADVVPLQQLANFKEKETDMPSYVKQIIEAGARTLVIPDYTIPKFSLGKITDVTVTAEPIEESEKSDEEESELPQPTLAEVHSDDESEDTDDSEVEEVGASVVSTVMITQTKATETLKLEPELNEKNEQNDPKEVDIMPKINHDSLEEMKKDRGDVQDVTESVDLEQFVSVKEVVKVSEPDGSDDSGDKMKPQVSVGKKEMIKTVIKDKSGVNGMVKMFFIGLVSFFVTVGIGVGLGLGFLSLSSKNQETDSPVAEVVSPTPVVEEATPTPSPEIKRTDYKVLVVNATTKAGYAGEIASTLEEAGFEDVGAGNAKGDYDEGTHVLLEKEDVSLIEVLSEDLGLKLSFDDTKNVEDPKESYDVVIVLAE